MVVQGHVAQQRAVQIFLAVKAMRVQDIGNATVETLDHAVGSGCPGLGQAVLDAQLLTQQIKLMLAAGLALAAGKQAIGELLAVVGQQPGDLDGTSLVQSL